MLRVLALTIVGCLGLTLAFSPVYPVFTLHVANKKCHAAQTDLLLLLLLGRRGARPGMLHVCYAVSTTSGGSSYDEGFPGVRTRASGVAGVEVPCFKLMSYPSPLSPLHINTGGAGPVCSTGAQTTGP